MMNMKSITILAFLLAYFACSSANPTENPKVCLENDACYAGSWQETRRGVRFASFQEIHYAQVCLPSQFDSVGFLQLRISVKSFLCRHNQVLRSVAFYSILGPHSLACLT